MMILLETPLWQQAGEQLVWVAAVATAVGFLSRTRPAKWLWRSLVARPATEWGERVVGSVVDEKVSKPNGGSSIADRLNTVCEGQETLADSSVKLWKRQDDLMDRIETIHSCLDRRFSEADMRIDHLTKMAELVLEEASGAKERVRQLFRSLDVPVFEADKKGWRLYVNPAWTHLTGLPIDEARGEGWGEAVHPEDRDRVFQAWELAVEGGAAFTLVYRTRNVLTGVVTNVRSSASPLHNGQESVVGWIGTLDVLSGGSTVESASPDALLSEES